MCHNTGRTMTFLGTSFLMGPTPIWSDVAQRFPPTSPSQRKWWNLFWPTEALWLRRWRYKKNTELLNGTFPCQLVLHQQFIFFLQKGNIFIIDYKIMDGLPTRVIDGKLAVLTAPLCLLYLNTEKKLQPIAIQVSFFVFYNLTCLHFYFSQT